MKKIIVFLADGCEEIEAFTTVDLLRRAGMQVDMASVSGEKMVAGAHGINIASDISISDVSEDGYDGYVLPGGAPGYKNLQASERVKSIVTGACSSGKLICAICAAPTVLGDFGLLKGKKACCYPGMENGLVGAQAVTDPVVKDGNIITSRGVGTAIEFALEIVAYLQDKKTAEDLGKAIVWNV